MQFKDSLDQLDEETKDNIAKSLWLPSLTSDDLPKEILDRLISDKNSNKSFGQRMQYRLKEMLDHPDSFTPSYRKRYQTLIKHSSSLAPHQAYVMCNFLGLDSSRGYKELPKKADLKFPQDDAPQFGNQVGWHFFVGCCKGKNGKEYGVELMFWQYSLLPLHIARHFGLSDLENQVLELHLGVSQAGDKHYRSIPIAIAGTTGLVGFDDDPFCYSMGKNTLKSLQNGSLFPLQLQSRGIDLGIDPPVEIEVDLTLSSVKDYLLQGHEGCWPCCGGVGTLYYSKPNLRVEPGKSTLKLKGEEVTLTGGKFWYDHQWGTGFMPQGNPRRAVLRAANNLAKPSPGGWDWFMAQFDNDTELTMAAMHSNDNLKFYEQTGPNPPGIMTAVIVGKFVDQDNKVLDISGTMRVTEWHKSEQSPDPTHYWVTHSWYPNKWEFNFQSDVPESIRNFVMIPIVQTGQTGFFANGFQYSEGAVYLKDEAGRLIGRGFAESTSYADSTKNMLSLAGLLDIQGKDLLRQPSLPSRLKLWIWSFLYINWPPNKAKLKQLIADCVQAGLQI